MLTVREVVEGLPVRVLAGESRLGREVSSGYVGDLLSLVMAKAAFGTIWVTVQGHPNVVAVAVLVGVSAIIVSEGARVEPAALERAEQEGIPILSSMAPSFDLVVGLSGLGVKGSAC